MRSNKKTTADRALRKGYSRKDAFLEVDYGASRKTRRGHFVVRLPSLPPISVGRLNVVGPGHGKQCNWCAACGGRYVLLEGTDQNLGHT